ncbi:MAG: ribosome silencing factor [Holophagae bacterium]|jgi:ribosome-associated protein|nr:ribosome silencing factor [Holophagae bacterium]
MKTDIEILKKIKNLIEDKKGDKITVINVSEVSSFTDFFIVCQGYNSRQNQAICDELREKLKKEEDIRPAHVEGYQTADWILMDYLDFIVHIFNEKSREFYKVERLWNDGKIVEL